METTVECVCQTSVLRRNAAEFSGSKLLSDEPVDSGDMFSGRTSPCFCFGGKQANNQVVFARPSRLHFKDMIIGHVAMLQLVRVLVQASRTFSVSLC